MVAMNHRAMIEPEHGDRTAAICGNGLPPSIAGRVAARNDRRRTARTAPITRARSQERRARRSLCGPDDRDFWERAGSLDKRDAGRLFAVDACVAGLRVDPDR